MLQFMRKHTKTFGYTFFTLIILSFIFWGVGPRDFTDSSGRSTKDVVATVAGQEITSDYYWRNYDQAEKLYRDVYEKFDDESRQQLKRTVLSTLVNNKMLEVVATDLGIAISDNELQDAIIHEKSFQRDGVFNRDIYLRTLELNNLTSKYYEDKRRNELLMMKMKALIEDTARLSPTELENVPKDNELKDSLLEALLAQKQDGALLSFLRGVQPGLNVQVNETTIL